jgi:uncharacterized RDD family membrane protein YckC
VQRSPTDDGEDLQAVEVALGLLITAGRAGASIARIATAPARAVARGSVDRTEQRLTTTGREALDSAHRLLPALDDALVDVAEERRVVERVLASPAFEHALQQVMSSPAVTAALSRQTTSVGEKAVALIRTRAAALDDTLAVEARGWFGRAAGEPGYGGFLARAAALVLDLALVTGVVLTAGVSVGLVAALAGAAGPAWIVGAVLGGAWLVLAYAYLVGCWATFGCTLGMLLFGLRVVSADGARPGFGRSTLRAAALALAIIPFFAGLVPVIFDRRRRGLHDAVAQTTVQRR